MNTAYQKLVLDNINTDYLDLKENATNEAKILALYDCFCNEYWWGINRTVEKETAFEQWIQGLPSALFSIPSYYSEVEEWGKENNEDTTDFFRKIAEAFFEMHVKL